MCVHACAWVHKCMLCVQEAQVQMCDSVLQGDVIASEKVSDCTKLREQWSDSLT